MKKNIRLGLLALFSCITLFTGYRMFALNEAQELWGHLPLFFYFSVWAVIVLLFVAKREKQTKNHWRWLTLSTASGILLSVGFPPLPLPFIMFIAFIPLLWVEKQISDLSSGTNKRTLFRYAYNTFAVWNILTTWWVGNTAFVAGIVAIWLNALFMTVPFLMFHQTKKTAPRVAYLAFIAYWLCFEYLHLNWEIAWVWLNLGNAFASIPSWVQWYEYTGTFGGSLWVLGVNVLLFTMLKKSGDKDNPLKLTDWAGALAAVLLPIVFSLVIFYNYEDQGTRTAEVILGQPNYEPHYRKFDIPKEQRDREIVALAKESIDKNTDYFILPETVFSNVDEDRPERNPTVRLFQPVLDSFPQVKIISGVGAYKILKKNDRDTPATRKRLDEQGNVRMRYESLNAAVQLQKDEEIQFYRKSRFVPGAELLPYKKFFFWLKPLVDKLDGSLEGLGTQDARSNFTSNSATVAPVICYESVFGDYHTGYIRKKANLIAIMTNDGWWDNTAGHKQHLAFASLRAIETRRWIARSANTGISAFINAKGEIVSQTEYDERTTLKGTVTLNENITFYIFWRDLIARIALFTTLLLLLNTFVKGRVPEK